MTEEIDRKQIRKDIFIGNYKNMKLFSFKNFPYSQSMIDFYICRGPVDAPSSLFAGCNLNPDKIIKLKNAIFLAGICYAFENKSVFDLIQKQEEVIQDVEKLYDENEKDIDKNKDIRKTDELRYYS